MSMTRTAARGRGHRWLLLLPFGWQVALVPLVDDVALRPFGLPFPMAWQMAGILFTTAIVGLVYRIDRARDLAEGPEAEIAEALASAPRGESHGESRDGH